MKRKIVLVVDNDLHLRNDICEMLRDRALDTLEAGNERDAMKLIRSHASTIDVALIDILLPSRPGDQDSDSDRARSAGLRIARAIREMMPRVRLIGMSLLAGEDIQKWFVEYGFAFLSKSWLVRGAASDFIDMVELAARKKQRKRKPRTFIVHGHDEHALHELAGFIQRNLHWPVPKILREMPSGGQTLIEKFEQATERVDIVFVLLTPDDTIASAADSDDVKRRARQNVIFELGYFYAKLQRTGGRIILLHKGPIELPSDIGGIVYLDISPGIESAGEAIRRELPGWLS